MIFNPDHFRSISMRRIIYDYPPIILNKKTLPQAQLSLISYRYNNWHVFWIYRSWNNFSIIW